MKRILIALAGLALAAFVVYVALLAGVLLDKSFGKDVLEAVFNDILNRDEQVKLPLLKSIHKDRAHPCWADAAWILDVTGESEHKPTD